MGLFREEALKAEKEKWLGQVIITSPVKLKFFVIFVVCILIALVIFLTTASFTKKQTITGQLVPDLGLIKVYSPQYGVITKADIEEGDFVHKGDILYILSSDREDANKQGIQEVISSEINNRLKLINSEVAKLNEQYEIDKKSTQDIIKRSKEQLDVLNDQISQNKQIVELIKKRQEQYEELYKKNYISRDQVERVKEELLSSSMNLNNIEREIINVQKELSNRQSELAGLEVKYTQQKSQYERNVSQINQELVESESRREIVIQAPQSGTITAVVGQVGQYVDGKRQLLSIIPEGSELLAQLYAPSQAIGFINEGAEVFLRYEAYPYQKFGQHKGYVESISKTALPKSELTDLITVNEYNPNVSYYRITVGLEQQGILAYGEERPLQAGMLVEADISVDKRKLYEWFLEPLFTLTGKLK